MTEEETNTIRLNWQKKGFINPGVAALSLPNSALLFNVIRLGSFEDKGDIYGPRVNVLSGSANVLYYVPLASLGGLVIHRIGYSGTKFNLFTLRYSTTASEPEQFQRLVIPVALLAVTEQANTGHDGPGYYLMANQVGQSGGQSFSNDFFWPKIATYVTKWGTEARSLRDDTIPLALKRISQE